MRAFVTAAIALCTCLVAGAAQAQAPAPAASPAPAPVPEVMPFDIPYGTPITLGRAQEVSAAAIAEATKRKWKMAITIVDPNGDIVSVQRMDGTQLASTAISPKKARAAVRFRRPTQVFFDAMETGHPYVATLSDDVVGSPGGRLLVEGGKIIGGIGVSGGTGGQDDVIAQAGAALIK
jgi:glc operon protein GlcG